MRFFKLHIKNNFLLRLTVSKYMIRLWKNYTMLFVWYFLASLLQHFLSDYDFMYVLILILTRTFTLICINWIFIIKLKVNCLCSSLLRIL